MLTVYHGTTCQVQTPDCNAGRPHLDFGQGFYVTNLRRQAEDWAQRTAQQRNLPPLLNIYELDTDRIFDAYRCLRFDAYDRRWLDFIVDSRLGREPWREYDYIEGGVADDRVIDTVQYYMLDIIDADIALRRLAMHQPNNQMCLLSQTLVDECLHHLGCELLAPAANPQQKGGKP